MYGDQDHVSQPEAQTENQLFPTNEANANAHLLTDFPIPEDFQDGTLNGTPNGTSAGTSKKGKRSSARKAKRKTDDDKENEGNLT